VRWFSAARREQTELEARIKGYELAFRMQAAAPEAVDLERETPETQQLYGLDRPETASFGRLCLLARRLVERGVRFVQLYHGAGSKWDAHSGLETNHAGLCRGLDHRQLTFYHKGRPERPTMNEGQPCRKLWLG
jgi:hypothetical protein